MMQKVLYNGRISFGGAILFCFFWLLVVDFFGNYVAGEVIDGQMHGRGRNEIFIYKTKFFTLHHINNNHLTVIRIAAQ